MRIGSTPQSNLPNSACSDFCIIGRTSMVTPLGTAVIGVGRIGHSYAQILSQLPDARLIAVCDLVPETAERVSRELNVPGYTDFRQMLASEPDIRAVCICT